MQRILGTLLVAVMVVFAGCGGVLGGGSNESVKTFTPAPDPTPKPTPTPVPQLAPGLTGEGIENVSALIAAHTSFLRNHSFTVRANTTWIAPNGSVMRNSTSIIRFGPPGEGFHRILLQNSRTDYRHTEALPVYTEWWLNGKRVLVKEIYANGTTTYERYPMTGEMFRRFIIESSVSLFWLFDTGNTTVTNQFAQNGTTLYRVRGTTRTIQWGNISLQLVVDSRGVIHKVRTVRERGFSGNLTRIHTMEFSNLGTTHTVERPSWVDEALTQTTPIPEQRRPYDGSVNDTDTNGTASQTTTSE